ncbi:MAG: F0F1 ATP synthase subunit epsilon [Roseiarcus sp.]
MASFHFELVSPDKQIFNGAAESVLVPGSEGDFVVLPQHAPVMAALRPGVVAIDEGGGKNSRFFVRGGFADVNPGGLIVLAETAIPAHELNAEWLAQQIRNAEEDLADAEVSDKQAAQDKLDRLREVKEAMKF